MSGRALAGLVALAFVLEVLAGLWPPLARLFDPLLIVAVIAALPGRTGVAFAVALVSGLLADGWSSRWIGEQALTHLVIAYPLALLARRIDLLAPVPAFVVLTAAVPISWALGLALGGLFDAPRGHGAGVGLWFAAAALNGIAGLLIWQLLRTRSSR